MKKYLLSAACLLGAFALAACSQNGASGGEKSTEQLKSVKNLSELKGTTWEPVFVDGANAESAPKADSADAPFMHFQDGGKINGYSGCNLFFGTVDRLNGKYDFTKLGSTRRMGPYADYETAFLKALSSSVEVKAGDGKLQLLSKDGKRTMDFKKSAPKASEKPEAQLSHKEKQLLDDLKSGGKN